MRRIVEKCPELRHKLSLNSTGDQVCAAEICGRELQITCETEELFEGEPTGRLYQILRCGHHRFIDKVQWESRPESQRNALWNKLLPFQQNAVRQVEESGFNCYLNYEMGTGKTPIAASVLRENLEELTPCLVICEAGDIYRWRTELIKWLGLQGRATAGNGTASSDLMELLSLTPQILTKDTTSAKVSKIIITAWTNIADDRFLTMLGKYKFKCVIADEAHMFKNEGATRSQGFIKLCSFIPHRIFLSGTWIENALREAFVPLNILDPRYFSSPQALESHCILSSSGKALTLDPSRRDYFFRRINKYVFRLTKEDAGIKLPRLLSYAKGTREPTWIDPTRFKSNVGLINDYNGVLNSLEEELESNRPSYGTVIGFMSQLRHFTGKMKVMGAAELISLRMMELPPEGKLCVGVHHKSVMMWLTELLRAYGHTVLNISDEAPDVKDAIETAFRKPENRILVASILGAGKGRNLQFCQNAIILERQWNKSKEEQFEQRFHRIKVDQNDNILTEFSTDDDVVVDYVMARKSFDEYFDHLVNLKGQIVNSADLAVDDVPDPGFIWELARLVVTKRLEYVGV